MLVAISCAGGLLVGMLLFLELGWRLGRSRRDAEGEDSRARLGAVDGAVFGLMGLLVAFTFSAAASRFEMRRQLIIQEANAIGTAWLRLDLVPESAQPALRDLFREYLDLRLAVYQELSDAQATRARLDQVDAKQGEIWSLAVPACRESPDPVTATMIPALNEMFDIASTRTRAMQNHTPGLIFILMGGLMLTTSLLAGLTMAPQARSWLHMFVFALLLSCTMYVILDLEYPRFGLIRIDASDEMLVDLREGMG